MMAHHARVADHDHADTCREPLGVRWVLLIAMIALGARVGWGLLRFYRGGDAVLLEFPDEQQYWLMAQSLWLGDGLMDELGFRATRMPLYPGILSVFTGIRHGIYIATALHWLLGAAAAVLTAGVARAMFGRRVAVVAGLLVAFDPFLVFFSSLLLTETLFITLMLALWLAVWPAFRDCDRTIGTRRWVLIGLIAAASVYARESGLGLVGAMLAVLVIWRRDRHAVMGSAIVAFLVFASLLPWAVRNQQTIGQLSFLTQRGGISLYDGVGPQATGRSDLGNIKQMPEVRGLGEVEWNTFFLDASFDAIRRDPVRIIRLAGTKLMRMWNPVPNVETYQSPWVRAVAACWSIPTFLAALIGIGVCAASRTARSRGALLLLLLPTVYLCLLHSLFVGSIRYRLSAIPLLHVLAGVAVIALWDRFLLRRKPQELPS